MIKIILTVIICLMIVVLTGAWLSKSEIVHIEGTCPICGKEYKSALYKTYYGLTLPGTYCNEDLGVIQWHIVKDEVR